MNRMACRWAVLTGLTVLCGCEQRTVVDKWQAVEIVSSAQDARLRALQAFVDTLGRNTGPEQNLALYRTRNTDSLRGALQSRVDSLKGCRNHVAEHTRIQILRLRHDSLQLRWIEDGDTTFASFVPEK